MIYFDSIASFKFTARAPLTRGNNQTWKGLSSYWMMMTFVPVLHHKKCWLSKNVSSVYWAGFAAFWRTRTAKSMFQVKAIRPLRKVSIQISQNLDLLVVTQIYYAGRDICLAWLARFAFTATGTWMTCWRGERDIYGCSISFFHLSTERQIQHEIEICRESLKSASLDVMAKGCGTILCSWTTQILNWKDGFWLPRNSRIAPLQFLQDFPWLAAIYLIPIAYCFAWLGNWPVAPQVLDSPEERGPWNCQWVRKGLFGLLPSPVFFPAKCGYIKRLRCVLGSFTRLCLLLFSFTILWHPYNIIYTLYFCNSKDSL